MASIEFGRNVVGLTGANSEEINLKTPHPVIHIMPNQKEYLAKKQYGGTIRLGAWPCIIKPKTTLERVYNMYGEDLKKPWYTPNPGLKNGVRPQKSKLIFERHRHRYEFNNKYKSRFEAKRMVFSGSSPDGALVEAIELTDHPFFVGVQYHPEYLSRPLTPHPLFMGFMNASGGS
jgi:CTP synthase